MKGEFAETIECPRNSPKVSIIVPAYNEEESIGEVLYQIGQLCKQLPTIEIIVVDDGSIDQTMTTIKKFPFVKHVVHERNLGKGAAVRTGFEVAAGDVFVIQDADSEYSPFNIPALLRPIFMGQADVVYGSRFKHNKNNMKLSHSIGNKILSLIARILFHVPITDVLTGHKCFVKEAIKSLNLKENSFIIDVEITAKVLKNGWRFIEVPIVYSRRSAGSPKVRYIDGIYCMIELVKEFLIFSRSKTRNLTARNK